ncbi:hypothetical protein IU421_14585 [Nocardia cyriacigeorgica]|uniref:hypothetical protein n=1 Tax=Nocardia cyriacigeorgica TaxID=135487 RepID=UPI001894FC86|nr:hypothetical protein [Nocardia cyriacigeorgica]MBF6515497.1 hypothetical protein [Nocardia cyriacigeorgica]
MLDTLALIALAATTALVAIVLFPRSEPAPTTAQPAKPPNPSQLWDTAVWVPGWPHEAPEQPPTLEQARSIMQGHRECTVHDCGRKRAAWDALVAAGRVVPRGAR